MRCDPEGLVEAVMTAYALDDYETAIAYYAPDATFAFYADNQRFPFAGEWRGREQIVACWHKLSAAFDVLGFEIRNIKSAGSVVRCQVHYELHHCASGERMDGVARLVFEIENGLIVREREYNDVERLRAFMRLCEHAGEQAAEVSAKQP